MDKDLVISTKKKKLKIFNSTIIIICVFFVLLFLVNKVFIDGDDKTVKEAFSSFLGGIEWGSQFYQQWGGRITFLFLINWFNNIPQIVFRIINSLLLIIGIYAMYKIAEILIGKKLGRKSKNCILIILFSSIFIMDFPVLSSGYIWLTGSINYFWPIVCMFIAIIPFIALIKEKELKNYYYIFFIIANTICCFAEQTAAVLIVFSTISLIWCALKKKKINRILIIHYGIIIVLALINLCAPGNSIRSQIEEIKVYPGYSMLSTIDKCIEGYLNLNSHLFRTKSCILLSIIAIISTIISIDKSKKVKSCIYFIPVICTFIYIYLFFFGSYMMKNIFDLGKYGLEWYTDNGKFIIMIINILILVLLGVQLFDSFKNKETKIIVLLLYLAGISSAIILGFSPSIYESMNRIFSVIDLIFVLIIGILSYELINRQKKYKYLDILMASCFSIIGICMYLDFLVNCTTTLMY